MFQFRFIYWRLSKYLLIESSVYRSYFYDFVIKNKKIIIEYNNVFWHPRKKEEWRGLGDYDKILKYQEEKKELAISRGYDVYYVWNDDDLSKKVNYLSGVIFNDRT